VTPEEELDYFQVNQRQRERERRRGARQLEAAKRAGAHVRVLTEAELLERGHEIVGSEAYRARHAAAKLKPVPATSRPARKETPMSRPSPEDERRALAQAIGFALGAGQELVERGVLAPFELDLIRQRGDQAVIEHMPMSAYRAMMDEDGPRGFDGLEQRARHLPAGWDQERFNRESDTALRKVIAAGFSNAWLQNRIDGAAALRVIKEVSDVPYDGDAEQVMIGVSLDTFTPAADAQFKFEPVKPEPEPPMQISDSEWKRMNAHEAPDPRLPAQRGDWIRARDIAEQKASHPMSVVRGADSITQGGDVPSGE
jgi:hypothetical protein